MEKLYDFTNAKIDKYKMYDGANGGKKGIIYNDKNYMLKFPSINKSHLAKADYSNSCISEYISCKIYNSAGIEAQDTLLGTFGNKIVVACEDFEKDGFLFKNFASLKNTIVTSEKNGYGTELEDILKTIDEQEMMPRDTIITHFWDMFVMDSLLGNFDRHNGNWGFLINKEQSLIKLAPVFDCGSCLYPQLDENMMKNILENPNEIIQRIEVFPNSAIKNNDIKINSINFFATTDNEDCLKSLKNVTPRINIEEINEIIDNTPTISEISKIFYKTMIKERKERILDIAYERAVKETKLPDISDIVQKIKSEKRVEIKQHSIKKDDFLH